MDILFSESKVILDWNKVLATVRDEIKTKPKEFLQNGGWDFLQPESDEEGDVGEEEIDDGDSAFEMDESEFDDVSPLKWRENEFSLEVVNIKDIIILLLLL